MLDIILFIWIAGMMIIITFDACMTTMLGGRKEAQLIREFLNGKKITRKERILTGVALIPLWFITFPLTIWAINYLSKESK